MPEELGFEKVTVCVEFGDYSDNGVEVSIKSTEGDIIISNSL